MATYSFLDIQCSFVGPGININLGSGAEVAAEGITITPVATRNIMTIGADGTGVHSLVAKEATTATVRLLKTARANAALQSAYNIQTKSGLLHGKNAIVLRDSVRGDFISLVQVAFQKRPEIAYRTEAGMNEWVFDCIFTDQILGVGSPEA